MRLAQLWPRTGLRHDFRELEQIAVRVGKKGEPPIDDWQVVVVAPSYLERAGRPRRPEALLAHRCVRQRVSADGNFLAWKLRSGKRQQTFDVQGSLILDDMRSVVGAVREGTGLGYVFEQFVARELASGALERVLPEYALVREAFFLYYPSRRRLPQKLRVFSDWFRSHNAGAANR